MKTRNLLLAMALPTLFAACTAEEIVNQADNNAVLENRALLGDLVVNVEGNVASRASWSEEDLKWGAWEEGDAFTAALTDGATIGTAENKLWTNYVWKKNAAGEWSTTSQMVEGLYSFYSYKGNINKNDRSLVKFDITNQKADLDEPTKVLNDHQLFFSPLYLVKAAHTNAEKNVSLPLTFYPYHSIAAFYIKNTSGQDLKISQIVAKGSFAAKGSISPVKIQGEKFVYSVRQDADGNYLNEYKLGYKTAPTTTTAGVEYTAKEIAKMWEMSDLAGVADADKAPQVVLNCDNWNLADGEEVLAYMNIPAGAQTAFEVQINVVDEKGNAKTVYVKNSRVNLNAGEADLDPVYTIASSGLNKTEFVRGKATAVFGLKSGQPKAINIEDDNLADASGTYVDDEQTLLDLIADGRGDVLVYNAGDLVLNSTIADALAENTACNLIFANPISIQDFEKTVELTKVTFKNKVTIKDEYDANDQATEEGTTVVFGEDVVFYDTENEINTELAVEKYSTVTMNNGAFGTVKNKGTMTVYALDASIQSIESEGTLTVDNGSAPEEEAEAASRTTTAAGPYAPEITVKGGTTSITGMNPVVTLNAGTLSYAAEVDEDGEATELTVDELTITRTSDKNASLTIGEDVIWKLKPITMTSAYTASEGVISKKLSVTNEGVIEIGATTYFGDLTNNGKIKASGKIVAVMGNATNAGEITVGTLEITFWSDLNSSGTFTNSGEIDGNVRADKGAVVTAASGSRMTLVNLDGSGYACARVNNTAGANITVPATNNKYIVYHEFEDCNLLDLLNLKYDLHNINTIVVTGTFTLDANDLANVTTHTQDQINDYFDSNGTKFGSVVNRIEMTDGAVLNVAAGFKSGANYMNYYISGDVKVQGWSKEKSALYLQKDAVVTLAHNSTLTVQNIELGTGNYSITGNPGQVAKIVCSNEALGEDDEYGKVVIKNNAVLLEGANAIEIEENALPTEE